MKYVTQYSHDYTAYFVGKQEGCITQLIWKCIDENKAIKFANALNSDKCITCRGSKKLGTACGKCIKCECVE